MILKVEMEDGTFELVANCNWLGSDDTFRVHHWGSVWLIATLNDDTLLVGDNGIITTMGKLRERDAKVTTTTKTGGTLRRARTFKDRRGINTEAKPFSKEEV